VVITLRAREMAKQSIVLVLSVRVSVGLSVGLSAQKLKKTTDQKSVQLGGIICYINHRSD